MITGYTMTITPDELKQIVREAVLETMTVKNDIDRALAKNRSN